MKFDKADFLKVQSAFPLLEYSADENCVSGRIQFFTKIVSKGENYWEYDRCGVIDKDAFFGEYDIKIDLNFQPIIKVYETSGKIREFANSLGIKPDKLHIFFDDDRCCLDYISTAEPYRLDKNLSNFINHKVFPFFAWQAYYHEFKIIPPCRDYPHNPTEARYQFYKELINSKLNHKCSCGSGKTLLDCCSKKPCRCGSKKIFLNCCLKAS